MSCTAHLRGWHEGTARGEGGAMNWRLNHGTADAATSDCGRWVITKLEAGRYELYDTKERKVIGTYPSVAQAQRAVSC